MKWTKLTIFMFFAIIVFEFQGFQWNPCTDEQCLILQCGLLNSCQIPETIKVMYSTQQAESYLDTQPTGLLDGVYLVEWDSNQLQSAIAPLTVQSTHKLSLDQRN